MKVKVKLLLPGSPARLRTMTPKPVSTDKITIHQHTFEDASLGPLSHTTQANYILPTLLFTSQKILRQSLDITRPLILASSPKRDLHICYDTPHQAMASSLTLGRGLFFMGNLIYSGGAFIADWNETHISNPRWPPHAKFHNGQTMSLGVLLALTSTYFAFRPAFSRLSPAEAKHSILTAAVVGSLYCVAGISAIFYPGTHWFDPEYEMKGMTQREIFLGQLVVIWVAYYLETRRIGKAKSV